MEISRGKATAFWDEKALAERRRAYETLYLDMGTGDGRFVLHLARHQPHALVIGMDACRENMRESARRAPSNVLFLIANAAALPAALNGCAATVTVNFPWGSLLAGLLGEEAAVPAGLARVMRKGGGLELRLNAGALASAGYEMAAGSAQVSEVLRAAGFRMNAPVELEAQALRAYPSTWAKRLAFGRDPRAVLVRGWR